MLKIYNSLTRKVEEFKPLIEGSLQVGMYTCGPTVYDFAHIGNFRTYTTADLLKRTLQYDGYDVEYIMNLTDVGHLTGDNSGDADIGEDRMEKASEKEGKSAWEIASFYADAFIKDFDALHLERPQKFVKATDHIKEQVDLIKTLEEKGYTYQTSDGIYFDTTLFPEYGKLSNLDQIKEGARVEINTEKRNARDFALWKFSPSDQKRQMEWKSPWGVGFPGWHIECSAMAMKYLGPSFDIHVGGIDLRETHHPNEIAQSEAATGVQFVKYWVHSAFMLVTGERMSKSLGNNYKIYDLEKEGYDPLALRYLYLQTHYRQEMNFTYSALEGAQSALNRLREQVVQVDIDALNRVPRLKDFEQEFIDAIHDDLNMPKALAVVWEMMKEPDQKGKIRTLLKFDKVLGLDLKNSYKYLKMQKTIDIPSEIQELIAQRNRFRKEKKFTRADHIRNRILKMGYEILDTKNGIEVRKIS